MIGIDAVHIDRLRRVFERVPGIEGRLFTPFESQYCRGRADPVLHFAGTLAAKEAVIKARNLGTLVAWSRRIEIHRGESGAPRATIRGRHDAPIHLSITHDGPVAVAVAVAPNGSSVNGRRQRSATAGSPDPSDGGVVPRPNQQLARYIGLGRRAHDPHAPSRSALRDATGMVQGTDFP